MSSPRTTSPFRLSRTIGARRRSLAKRARGIGVTLSVVLAATLLPAQAWAAPPPNVPRDDVVLPALQTTDSTTLDEAKQSALDGWSGPALESPPEYDPTALTPPPGLTVPVSLDSAGGELVQAGSLPVSIGQASATPDNPNPPAPSGTWDVKVEPRDTTETTGIDGAIITVTPPSTGSTPIDVQLDYSKFTDLYGTDWASRLKLVQLPECFLASPRPADCTTPVEIPSQNDPGKETVRATVDPATAPAGGLSPQSGGGPVVLAATDRGAGAAGTYKATSLSPSGTWSAGGSGGGFSWSYPLNVPAAAAGPTPKIAFSYSSQAVDGKTSVANAQASWVGDGWDYHPGFVERRYRTCSEDLKSRKDTPNNDSATDRKKSDLCWAGDNVVMSLGGTTTELVHDETTGKWVPADDNGIKVERETNTGVNNGAKDGERWVVTTQDGTKYYFGLHDVDGAGSRPVTDSVFTVPVFGNHPGEPCHAAAYADSSCTQAWRWNLDYVEDVHGNAMIIDWEKKTNHYAKNEKTEAKVPYVRGGYPTQILYGLREGNLTGTPAGKVLFTVEQRCFKKQAVTCSDAEFESKNYEDKQPWWDTPSTLHCPATPGVDCLVTSPTFWARERLTSVTTLGQRTPGSTSMSYVDQWNLIQSFPKNRGDTHPPLWLEAIARTGFGTATNSLDNQETTALPPVSFLPNVVDMPNRVRTSSTDATPDFDRLRVETIRTETGGEIAVDYSDPCTVGNDHPVPEANDTRCFPVHWSPDPDLKTPPIEWFNKYVVEKVTEKDRVAGQPDVVTSYSYEGDPAWAKDTDEFSKRELRTYSQWRGYTSVLVKKGKVPVAGEPVDPAEPVQSQTRTRYFRGMSGDAGRPTVIVKDSEGSVTLGEDLPQYQGRTAETVTYTKTGGSVASREFDIPWSQETATRRRSGPETYLPPTDGEQLPALVAYRTGTIRTDAVETISGDKPRTVRTINAVEPAYGLTESSHTYSLTPNDSGGFTTGDQTCTRNWYVHNTGAHLIGIPSRVRTTTGDCSKTADGVYVADTLGGDKVVADTRTSYDALNAFGAAPVKGLAREVNTVDGDGHTWMQTARTTYDALGRVSSVMDAAGQPTTTEYDPPTGPAFTVKVTNAEGHATTTLADPARGTPLEVTDPNSRKVTTKYDDLGRITGVWTPSRQGAEDPTVAFDYQIAEQKPPAVTTRTLRDNGTYDVSVTIYDGLLRQRQTQTEALGGGRIITDTEYNGAGTVRQTNNGYFAKVEPEPKIFTPQTVYEVPNSTQLIYDGLGRTIKTTTLYEGVAQYSSTAQYAGDWTLNRTAMSVDGLVPQKGSHAVKAFTDTLGRTTQVQHATKSDLSAPNPWNSTKYAYDPRGRLANVTDAANNAWTYTYDARGRLTASKDPDIGDAWYDYNALDQPVRSKDLYGRYQYMEYDKIGRMTKLWDDAIGTANGGTKVAEWTFDSLPNAKGYPVASVRYNDGAAYTSEVTGYDSEYRPTGAKITIPDTGANGITKGLNGTYAYSFTHTPTGNPSTTVLPKTPGGLAAEEVLTRYNGENAPISTSGLAWYTADTMYSPYGEALRTTSGEQPRRVWTTNIFDEHTGRMNQSLAYRETSNPNQISNVLYGYDIAGNITSVTSQDPSGSRTDRQCFAYDPMGQLVHAWTGTANCPTATSDQGAGPTRSEATAGPDGDGYWHEYKFDAIGNRTEFIDHDLTDATKDDTHTYTYGVSVPGNGTQPPVTAQPHTLAKVVSKLAAPGSLIKDESSYGYDLTGNTTTRVTGGNTQQLLWDRRNKLTSVDTNNDGTPDTKYLYDADGNRLIEDNGTTRTLFLGESEITVNTAGTALDAKRYYTHPGAPTTVRSTGGKDTDHTLTVLLTDQHNTATTAIEQTAGQAVTRRKFDPYGNTRGSAPTSWPSRHTFLGTGIDDPTTDLTHIGAREYDPTVGRFISADPIIDIADPLQMNGYTYANGNPVTNSDPTGLCQGRDPHNSGCTSVDPNKDYVKPDNPADSKKKGDGSGTKGANKGSVTVNGTPLPTPEELVKKYRISPKLSYAAALNTWARQTCSGYSSRDSIASFCDAAGQLGLMGTTPPIDVLEILGARDYIDCAGGDGDACKGAALDIAISVVSFGIGKAAKVAFKAIKQGIKHGDDASPFVKCVTQAANSFVAGTQVELADGSSKPIEEIKVGDKVLATDPETGKTEPKVVTATILTTDDKRYVELTIRNGSKQDKLTTTDHHPFWSESEHTWLNASDLEPGMTLRSDDGSTVPVTAVHAYTALKDTYNLTVLDIHTYYVLAGETPVLVHNSTCPGYENPGHHDPTGGPNSYVPKKAVLPGDAEEQFAKSVLVDGTRWTKVGSGKSAEYYRYFDDGNGKWHWSGSTSGVTKSGTPVPIPMSRVPIQVKRG